MTKIEEVAQMVIRVEAKTDLLIQMMSSMNGQQRSQHTDSLLSKLTTKQHACLQMLLLGKSNAEIAKVFEVTINTAKVYVRSIASKLGVNTRNQIIVTLYDSFNSIDEEEYKLLSGGLPKDWAKNYKAPDRFKSLYAVKTR